MVEVLKAIGDWLSQPLADWLTLVVLKFLVAFLALIAAQRNRKRSGWAAFVLLVFGLGVLFDLIHATILKAPPFLRQDLLTYAPLTVLLFMLLTRGVEDGYGPDGKRGVKREHHDTD